MTIFLNRIQQVRQILQRKKQTTVAEASAESLLMISKIQAAEYLLQAVEDFINSDQFSSNSTIDFQHKLILFTIEYAEILATSNKLDDEDILLHKMSLMHLSNNYNTRSLNQTAAGIALFILGLALVVTLLVVVAPPLAMGFAVGFASLITVGFGAMGAGISLSTYIAASGKEAPITAASSKLLAEATEYDKVKNPDNHSISAQCSRFFAVNPQYSHKADLIWDERTEKPFEDYPAIRSLFSS